MRPADIPAGVALCRASHWNQTRREWELFLRVAGDAVIVAELAGEVVGTAVTMPYEPRVGWVAMVLVDLAHRGRGIGRALLTRAIASARPEVTLGLDATPAGRELYLTLGFTDVFGLARWRRADAAAAPLLEAGSDPGIEPMRPSDAEAVASLDYQMFGADRRAVLDWCLAGAPELAWVCRARATTEIDGFVLGRHGHDADHVGPVVARSADRAIALVTTCLAVVRRPVVIIDVPDVHTDVRDWLRGNGFEIERPFTRMRRGTRAGAADLARLYAAAGPELG